jgi:hypothetical protein
MNASRWICSVIASLILLGADATSSLAQWGPYGSGGWFGGWGASDNTVNREIHQQDRAQAQAFAASRNARIGGEVRSTLINEANARTQSSLAQQQSARDWWFQTQQQQTAERSARASARSLPPLAYSSVGNAAVPSAPAHTDSLIRWPAVLAEPQFAAERATIETPFARFAHSRVPVTAAEYESIIATAATMRQQLDFLAAQITAAEYIAATKFLDQMAGEARERIAAMTAEPSSSK